MKIFKENPVLLIWMLVLTIGCAYSLSSMRMNVNVTLDVPEGAKLKKVETKKHSSTSMSTPATKLPL